MLRRDDEGRESEGESARNNVVTRDTSTMFEGAETRRLLYGGPGQQGSSSRADTQRQGQGQKQK